MNTLTQLSTLLQDQSLEQALAHIENLIRQNPSNVAHRMALFQILLITGAWERALKQLQTCVKLQPDLAAIATTYGDLIRAEHQRENVFLGKSQAHFYSDPPIWLSEMAQALQHQNQNEYELADQCRSEALSKAPDTPCTLHHAEETTTLPWITDMDTRIGPVMEVMLHGRYFWIPLSDIKSIQFAPLTDLRDLVWIMAEIEFKNAEPIHAFIPTRYPFTHLSEQSNQLVKTTQWQHISNTCFAGLGQRSWMSEQTEHPILQCKRIDFNPYP